MMIKRARKPKAPTGAEGIIKKAETKIAETKLNISIYEEDGVFKTLVYTSSGAIKSIQSNFSRIKWTKAFEMKPTQGRTGRYKAIKCHDENNILFDSKLELVSHKEFEVYLEEGYISELTRQTVFPFVKAKLPRTSYRPDIIFQCEKDFSVETADKKKSLQFKRGVKYFCDVKSPGTRGDSTYKLKRGLMMACYGIEVTEILRTSKKVNGK